jgi:hypothetical protein
MHSDKDLPFGDITQVSLDETPDRAMARRNTPDTGNRQHQEATSTSRKTARSGGAGNEVQRQQASRLPWVLVSVVFVLLIAVTGWMFLRMQSLESSLHQQQDQASARLDNLSSHLSATSSNASKASDKLEKTLEANSRELHRLSANDLATRKRVSQLEDMQAKLKGSVAKIDDLQKQLADMEKQQKLAAITSGQLQMQQDINTSSNKALKETLSKQTKELNALAGAPATLTSLKKDIQSLQASIKAFDRWRVQVNNQLAPQK